MINKEVAGSKKLNTTASQDEIEVAVLVAAILAAQFVSGGFRPANWTWLHFPAIASIVLALYLHFLAQRPGPPSPTSHLLIRGHMLIILALCILVVGARSGFPIASYADAPANQLHGVLREKVTFVCAILTAVAMVIPILSRTARLSTVFWLSFSLNLVLLSSSAMTLRHLSYFLFRFH